jgi:hypothetical protein
MRFTCTRFPDGEVPISTSLGIVVFQDGVAEVEDTDLATALLEVPDLFGVRGEAKKVAKKAVRKPKGD